MATEPIAGIKGYVPGISEAAAKHYGLRDLFADLTPEIPTSLFYSSLIAGFMVMVTLSAKPFQSIPIAQSSFPLLTFISKYILDVVILQAASLCLLIYLAYKYYSAEFQSPIGLIRVSSLSHTKIFIFFVLFFSALMTLECLFQLVFLKRSFHYGVPLDAKSDTFITSYFLTVLRVESHEGSSAPSGFAFMQTTILLLFLVLAHQKYWAEVICKKMNHILYGLFYSVFILVLAIRIFRGRHSFFDVGIAVGAAVVLFWFFFVSLNALVRRSSEGTRVIAEFLAPLATYGIAILFYCQETKWWLWSFLAMFVALSLLYHLGPGDEEPASQEAES
jgi:hypothetical protein